MDRRAFLRRSLLGVGAAAGGAALAPWVGPLAHGASAGDTDELQTLSPGHPPSFSVIPVVGDGKWIWTAPPTSQRGYLEPRPYRARVGIELVGTGDARRIMATTTAPIQCEEQKVDSVKVNAQGCQAKVRALTDGAAS